MESPLAQLRFWLILMGVLEPKNTKFKYFYRAKTTLIWFIISNTILDSLINMLFMPLSLIDKIETCLYFVSCIHVGAHQVKFVLNREKLEKFFEEIELLYAEGVKDEKNKVILEERVSLTKRINNLNIVVIESFILSAFLVAFSFTFWTQNPTAPFKIWTPIKAEENYFLTCLYQFIVIFIPVQSSVAQHMAVVTISVNVAVQFKILQNLLKKRQPDSKEDHVYCYILHRRLIQLVKVMNELFGGPMFIEIIVSSVQCCVTGYAIKIGGIRNPRTLTFVLNFITCLMLPGLICVSGNLIASEAEKVHRSAYLNKWYEESPSQRKDLLLLSTMAAKNVKIQFRHVMMFDLERYSLVLQGAYSYTTVLRMMDN